LKDLNTTFTRTRLVNTLTPIFERAKNNEGLYDYLIVCDERNNTPEVIDSNQLVVDIYIKPVKASEFILINFFATRTDASFQEIVGA
jgi:phage tail sheath protein FI